MIFRLPMGGAAGSCICVFSITALAGTFSAVNGAKASIRSSVITPFVSKALGSASARVMTPKGEVKSGWYFEGDRCVFSIELPCNMRASVWLPDGQRETIGPGKTRLEITGGNLTL